jgi:hypothetical protein
MRSWLAMPPENFSARVGRPRTTPLLVSSAAMAYLRCCVSASGRRHVWRAVRDGEADRVEVERLARGELWRLRAHWRRVLRSIMGGYRVRAEVRMAVIQADGVEVGQKRRRVPSRCEFHMHARAVRAATSGGFSRVPF